MPIFDNDGTINREIGKVYDNNGITTTQIGKLYDNNGATSSLIYSADELYYDVGVFGDGVTSFTNFVNVSGGIHNQSGIVGTELRCWVYATMTGSTAGLYLTPAVDVTGLSTIKFTVRTISPYTPDGSCGITRGPTTSSPGTIAKAVSVPINSAWNTITLDVSSFSGLYNIIMYTATWNGTYGYYCNRIIGE